MDYKPTIVHLVSVCHIYFHYRFAPPVFHSKYHPDTLQNINTSEINQRLYNKHRTNNAVYLAQSEKYDNLAYITQTHLEKGAEFHLNIFIVVNMFTVSYIVLYLF
jgi:hypothetical protein